MFYISKGIACSWQMWQGIRGCSQVRCLRYLKSHRAPVPRQLDCPLVTTEWDSSALLKLSKKIPGSKLDSFYSQQRKCASCHVLQQIKGKSFHGARRNIAVGKEMETGERWQHPEQCKKDIDSLEGVWERFIEAFQGLEKILCSVKLKKCNQFCLSRKVKRCLPMITSEEVFDHRSLFYLPKNSHNPTTTASPAKRKKTQTPPPKTKKNSNPQQKPHRKKCQDQTSTK